MRRLTLLAAVAVTAMLAITGCSKDTGSTAATPSANVSTTGSPTPTPEESFGTYESLLTAFDAMFGSDGGPDESTTVEDVNRNLASANITDVTTTEFTYEPLATCLTHDSGTRLLAGFSADRSLMTLRFTEGSCVGTDNDPMFTINLSTFTINQVVGSDAFKEWARNYVENS